jgi:hypothetical protein
MPGDILPGHLALMQAPFLLFLENRAFFVIYNARESFHRALVGKTQRWLKSGP